MKIRKITKKMLMGFARDAKRYASYDRKASDPKNNFFVFGSMYDASDFGYLVYDLNDKTITSLVERQEDGKFSVTLLSNLDAFR